MTNLNSESLIASINETNELIICFLFVIITKNNLIVLTFQFFFVNPLTV